MKKPLSVAKLVELGRVQLSKTFFMRDFLFSDIAAIHGLSNVPDNPGLAIAAGARLCQDLLEPLQDAFGRIAIRSAYRSAEVNGYGNAHGLNCASNDANAAGHIWDKRDADECMGATACIVVPRFADSFSAEDDWKRLAWWIHDHLPYATIEFYPVRFAFNLQWHERPARTIYSHVPGSRGWLTKPGMANHAAKHRAEWRPLEALMKAPPC